MTIPNKNLGFFIAQVALGCYDYHPERFDLEKIYLGLQRLQMGRNMYGRKLTSDHLGYININNKICAAYE
jgi:hypothetical protein